MLASARAYRLYTVLHIGIRLETTGGLDWQWDEFHFTGFSGGCYDCILIGARYNNDNNRGYVVWLVGALLLCIPVFGNVLPELTGWAFQRSDERILQLQVFSFLYDATKEVFDCKYTNWIRVQEISSDFHYHLYTAFVLENRIDSLQLRAKLDYIISLELDALEAQIALQRLALHYMHELVRAVVAVDMSAANVCQGYADRYWIQSKYKSLKRSEARQQFYKILLNLERPDQILSEYIDSARELQRQANASALDLEVAWTTLRATYDLFVPGVLVD